MAAFAQLFTVLLGGNEVSDAGAANAGDPDGGGTATALIGGTDLTLCYAILVTGNRNPDGGAHHGAATGTNGPTLT